MHHWIAIPLAVATVAATFAGAGSPCASRMC